MRSGDGNRRRSEKVRPSNGWATVERQTRIAGKRSSRRISPTFAVAAEKFHVTCVLEYLRIPRTIRFHRPRSGIRRQSAVGRRRSALLGPPLRSAPCRATYELSLALPVAFRCTSPTSLRSSGSDSSAAPAATQPASGLRSAAALRRSAPRTAAALRPPARIRRAVADVPSAPCVSASMETMGGESIGTAVQRSPTPPPAPIMCPWEV